jgi:hypothetical protein
MIAAGGITGNPGASAISEMGQSRPFDDVRDESAHTPIMAAEIASPERKRYQKASKFAIKDKSESHHSAAFSVPAAKSFEREPPDQYPYRCGERARSLAQSPSFPPVCS